MGFAGVLLIARPWATSGAVDPRGVGYLLLGSASVGLSFVYAKRYLSSLRITPAALTTYQMGIALVLLAVTADTTGIGAVVDDPAALVGLVLGLGLLGTGVAYILYYLIVEKLGALTASSSTYIPPLIALAIGALLAGEPLRTSDALAVGLILLGVLTVRWAAPRPGSAGATSASPPRPEAHR